MAPNLVTISFVRLTLAYYSWQAKSAIDLFHSTEPPAIDMITIECQCLIWQTKSHQVGRAYASGAGGSLARGENPHWRTRIKRLAEHRPDG